MTDSTRLPHAQPARERAGAAPPQTRLSAAPERTAEAERLARGPRPMAEQQAIRSRLRRLIVSTLNLDGLTPERIADDEPLFGSGLGLDSVDALELVVALEKEYGISIASHEVDRSVFGSLASLAGFVERRLSESRSRLSESRSHPADGQ